MPSGSSDTNAAAEQVQIALVRQADMAHRVNLAADLTRFAREAAYRALHRRNPVANALELDLLFWELAIQLRAALMTSADEQDQ